MSPEQLAELRTYAAKLAAEAPPLSDETRERLAHLLQPGLQAVSATRTTAAKAA